ncbi:hypothetical protein [Methanosarcina spelaei]|uniref:hypothetical protein n=1 Tax=Methanosarcina spelaei TaxID=1036679 RepID=UPI001483914B|nr:hypothetical protein [Methanosarcina spelaei]
MEKSVKWVEIEENLQKTENKVSPAEFEKYTEPEEVTPCRAFITTYNLHSHL